MKLWFLHCLECHFSVRINYVGVSVVYVMWLCAVEVEWQNWCWIITEMYCCFSRVKQVSYCSKNPQQEPFTYNYVSNLALVITRSRCKLHMTGNHNMMD